MWKKEAVVFDAHGRHAQGVAFTRDGRRLVSVGQDARVRLWSVPGFEPESAFEGHEKSVNTISFDPDERLLATGSTDATVRVWSFPGGETRRVLEKQVSALYAPAGGRLATVSTRGRVTLWDREGGREEARLPAVDERVFSLAFDAAGETLFVGGTGTIHRVSLPAGKTLGTLEGHSVAVACLRLAPDGERLASTGADGNLRLWSIEEGEELLRVQLAARGIFQIAFSPEGDRVTVGADNRIQTFSCADGARVGEVELEVKGVYGIAVSPDGRWLANAAADGKVRVWERDG